MAGAGCQEEELVLITPVQGVLAEPPSFNADQLKRVPVILREQGSANRMVVEEGLKRKGLTSDDLQVAMELSSDDAIKTSVAAGHGVALISNWCVRAEVRTGTIRVAPLEGISFTSRWTLYFPKAQRKTRLHRSLLRTLKSPAERGFC